MKQVPQAIEAERSILGACLQFPQAVYVAIQEVEAEDFYNASNRSIFASLCSVQKSGVPVDAITVIEALRADSKLYSVGGPAYVASLMDHAIGWASTKAHCLVVKDRSIARAAIGLAGQLQEQCTDGVPAKEAIEEFGTRISMLNRGGSSEPKPVSRITGKVLDRIDRIVAGEEDYGIQTGFADIDRKIVGMAPGDLIIVAARPSMGKTALAMNIADNVASRGIPTLIFSLEMSEEQLVSRQISARAMISGDSIRKGNITDTQRNAIRSAARNIEAIPMMICDKSGLSIQGIQSIAKFSHIRSPIGLVVVDYIQLASSAGVGKNGTREQEVSAITRGLKGLAKDLQCPVIALSQLNRSLEARTDKRPMMSDLRESGAIEQDADVIMFIYRDDFYNKSSPIPGEAEILIRKQRNGPTGDVRLGFQGDFSRFVDLYQGGEYGQPD